jgi:hypothetical protein
MPGTVAKSAADQRATTPREHALLSDMSYLTYADYCPDRRSATGQSLRAFIAKWTEHYRSLLRSCGLSGSRGRPWRRNVPGDVDSVTADDRRPGAHHIPSSVQHRGGSKAGTAAIIIHGPVITAAHPQLSCAGDRGRHVVFSGVLTRAAGARMTSTERAHALCAGRGCSGKRASRSAPRVHSESVRSGRAVPR